MTKELVCKIEYNTALGWHAQTIDNPGKNCVLIGAEANSEYDNCVVIGSFLRSTKPNQIIIGNKEIEVSGDISTEDVYAIKTIMMDAISSMC